MTETFIAHVNGSHVCYVTRTGVDRAFIGCSHDTPREAIDHTTERKENNDADPHDPGGLRDCYRPARPSLVGGTPRSEPDRSTPPQGRAEEDSGLTPNRASGHPADGPRRPAPTGATPPAPVGAPDLGLVP